MRKKKLLDSRHTSTVVVTMFMRGRGGLDVGSLFEHILCRKGRFSNSLKMRSQGCSVMASRRSNTHEQSLAGEERCFNGSSTADVLVVASKYLWSK
jgi:hypothetical protein